MFVVDRIVNILSKMFKDQISNLSFFWRICHLYENISITILTVIKTVIKNSPQIRKFSSHITVDRSNISTPCAGMTCHARRELFVPNCSIFSVLSMLQMIIKLSIHCEIIINVSQAKQTTVKFITS